MSERLIECVPNFSEGQDQNIIRQIADSITSVEGVCLLNVDPGYDTNRTVMTFAGVPECVVEAAYRAVIKASELIDMSRHKGAHPRIGACDVCPLVPISGVTMEECVEYARALAKRVGESGIAVYCYENAAFRQERKNLAACRRGEYEGIAEKLADINWLPDFGPTTYNNSIKRSGISVIGAREFLAAINFNLNTRSKEVASEIARQVREKRSIITVDGRPKQVGGDLKGCKAIGWYIEEYGIAQVSMNVTDLKVTPLHKVFEQVCKRADEKGVKVTGSELIGLLPKKALLDAGYHFAKQYDSKAADETSEELLLQLAVQKLGLADLKPFNFKERIIEYLLIDHCS